MPTIAIEAAAAATAPELLCSGHAACPGCSEPLTLRHILAVLGPDTVAVIPPSCMAIIAGPQPFSSLRIPVYQPTLEASAAAASGLRRALDAQGKRDTQVIVLAGDGGTYDIGLQCLSSAAERNENILYFCLDNEGYMNTGAQKSSSTPHFARTGSTPAGKTTRKKNLTEIMAAHGVPYVATASVGDLPDLRRKVAKAKGTARLRLITLLIPCLDGWGLADDGALGAARAAVASGAFPLLEVEDGCAGHAQLRRRRAAGGRLPGAAAPLPPAAGAHRRRGGGTAAAEIDEGWARLVQRADRPLVHPLERRAAQHQHLVAVLGQQRAQLLRIGVGVQHHRIGQAAEAQPGQIAQQVLALRRGGGYRTGGDDGPLPLPGRLGVAVQAAVGGLEAAPPGFGQAVVAAPADRLRLQPAFARQPRHRGAHGALVDTQRFEQRDHAAQAGIAAAVRDGVAVDGDDQRLGLGRQARHHVFDQGVLRGLHPAIVAARHPRPLRPARQ
jgi:pyruvate/2-oxoacid:ferredoxin oxidoreductase beta subunit